MLNVKCLIHNNNNIIITFVRFNKNFLYRTVKEQRNHYGFSQKGLCIVLHSEQFVCPKYW